MYRESLTGKAFVGPLRGGRNVMKAFPGYGRQPVCACNCNMCATRLVSGAVRRAPSDLWRMALPNAVRVHDNTQ